MRVLVIDNYDSFTYNLVQYLGALGSEITVLRNDAIAPEEIFGYSPDRILISPGPGGPDKAGISKEVIRVAAGRVPILGVCLGHQCLAEVYGGRIVRGWPVHGKISRIHHNGEGLFAGVGNPFEAARYHSLVVAADSVPDELSVTAKTEEGIIMGLRHKKLPVEGIQFHPESFLTPPGIHMMSLFLGLKNH